MPTPNDTARLFSPRAAEACSAAKRRFHFEDPARTKTHRGRAPQATDVSPEDAGLWDALRACRRDLADEQGVPAYVIFHDKTLHDMLQRRPSNEAELLSVNGVGQAKLERYGARFLEVLAE